MATQLQPSTNRLEPALESLLARLRRRIRAFVWADGVATTVAVLAGGFWISLATDWLVELPRPLRIVAIVVLVAALAHVIYRHLIARLLVPLADRNMAVLLERRFGQFHDGLLTAVELAERPEHAADFNPEMLNHTRRAALARATQVDLGEIFNRAPLVRRISLAMTLVLAALVFVVAAPAAAGVWARRNLLLSDELWPRATHLLVVGFDEHERLKIARGSDWALAVKADAALGREIPEVVEVRYSTTDGARGRETMSREGVVLPGQARYQDYSHTFKGVLTPLEFYVQGGDDRQGPYYLDVVESPTISRMTLACEYPAYMHRAAREVPVAGLMQLPRGTQITIRAEANKPLVAVQIDDVAGENASVTHRLDLAAENGAPGHEFQFSLPRLDGDKTLLFTLFDADGIRSLEAVRLALSAVADEPPQVNVQPKGIGTAITPQARIPAAGEVSDDYGVARVWFEFHPDDAPPRQQPLAATIDGQEKLAVADALEVRDLQLQPKQKLHWSVQAADGFALDSGPNVGTSQRYAFDVVTPEQLRSMLEARELMLRRRFETIVSELTDTRDLLVGVALSASEAADSKEKAAADAKREPGDKAEEPTQDDGAEQARQMVQVQRVVQNVERSAHETLQVAEAFDEIREEMINNRVDTEELKTRLKDGVADPLRRIVATHFPPAQAELVKLSGQLADPKASAATKALALAKIDTILVEMKQVLDKMLELETFNEVLDLLRQIIDEQQKVNTETKDKQKEKLRDLTE